MTTIFEVILQTLLAFFSILFLTRLLGKQQIAQLTFYDYLNGITFGSIAAALATDLNQRTWQHLIGLVLFAFLTWLMSFISLKNREARKVLNGEPAVVIHNGMILEENLRRYRISIDDLLNLLHGKDIFSIEEVEFAVLETNGTLGIIKKPHLESVTKGDLNLKLNTPWIPTPVIIDGQLLIERLNVLGVSQEWLTTQIEKQLAITDISDIILATIDNNNHLYVDSKNDPIKKLVQLGDITNS